MTVRLYVKYDYKRPRISHLNMFVGGAKISGKPGERHKQCISELFGESNTAIHILPVGLESVASVSITNNGFHFCMDGHNCWASNIQRAKTHLPTY